MSDVQPVSRTLTQEMIDAYAEASGDHNPIHVNAEFARSTPLAGTIAHGMLVLATISEMMTAAFGSDWLAGGRLDVRFRTPARPGDTVTTRAVEAGERDGSARFNVECVNQSGEVLISGTAEVSRAG